MEKLSWIRSLLLKLEKLYENLLAQSYIIEKPKQVVGRYRGTTPAPLYNVM